MILSQRHLPEDDLVLFALQLLEGEELERAIEHLEHCEDCRHDVARFQGDLVGYALAQSELHSPPAQARDRLLKRVAKEKKVIPVERAAPVERTRAVERQERQERQERPTPAERPLQQVAERLAGRSSNAVERSSKAGERFSDAAERSSNAGERSSGSPERSSGTVRAAGSAHDEDDPRGDSRSQLRAADSELFLASRGRGGFATERDDEPEERDETRRSRRGLLITMAATGWAIAACMAVMAGLQYRQRQNVQTDAATMAAQLDQSNQSLADTQAKLSTLTDPNAMQVALQIPSAITPQPKPEGHVSYMANKGSLVFIGDHLTPLPPGKTYELWLLQPAVDGKDQPQIPAGLFKPDERGVASVVLPDMPKGLVAKGFGVTVEDDGGSKSPTGSIVLVGF